MLIGEAFTDVTISFIRDRSFEEEFFLVIDTKSFNQFSLQKDRTLVPIDDIQSIEHNEVGSTRFELVYLVSQKNLGSKSVSDLGKQDKAKLALAAIGGLFQKMKKSEKLIEEQQIEKEERTEIFESKYVKEIISAFNSILSIQEQEE